MLVLLVLLFLSSTPESPSALGKNYLFVWRCSHVFCAALSVRNGRGSRIHRSFTEGDVTSATGGQSSFFKGNLGK